MAIATGIDQARLPAFGLPLPRESNSATGLEHPEISRRSDELIVRTGSLVTPRSCGGA
jgi:hypothetical protein